MTPEQYANEIRMFEEMCKDAGLATARNWALNTYVSERTKYSWIGWLERAKIAHVELK